MLATVPATEEFRADLSLLDNNARQAGVGIDAARQAFMDFNTVSGETDSSIEAVSNLLQAGFTESNLQIAVEGLANAAATFPDTLKIETACKKHLPQVRPQDNLASCWTVLDMARKTSLQIWLSATQN